MRPVRVSLDNWYDIVKAARKHAGNEQVPIWSACVNYYSVCVPSIVTELSRKLWYLHQRIGGTRNENYDSYYNLPAFWVSACDIIDNEIARIDKVRADKAERQQRELLRRVNKPNGNK